MEAAVVYIHFADRSRSNTKANTKTAAPHIAIFDENIFASISRCVMFAACTNGKAVIACLNDTVLDGNILCTVDGETIGIGNSSIGINCNRVYINSIATAQMNCPARSVFKRHSLNANIFRKEHRNHRPWTKPLAINWMKLKTILVPWEATILIALAKECGAIAVDNAFASYCNISCLVRKNEMATAPLFTDGMEVLRKYIVGIVV